jgi:hypothetical protein
VKIKSLTPTILLTFSLCAAFQAQAADVKVANVAPATIELAHCETNSTTHCAINDSANAAKAQEVDLNALPAVDAKNPQADEPAAPVPEPESMAMMMVGLLVLGVASYRRKSSAKFMH